MSSHTKGRRWRRKTQDWFDELGWATWYRQLGEPGDDIRCSYDDLELSIECKNHKAITLAAFVDQCDKNALPEMPGICVVHRPGRPEVDDAYFVMSGRSMRALLGLVTGP